MKHKMKYPGASPYNDARGKRRWRYRKNGKTFQLGTDYGSEEFKRRYEEAVKGAKPQGLIGQDRVVDGTVNDLVARWYKVAFAGENLSDSTKRTYRAIIERFREKHGEKRVKGMKVHHVEAFLAEMADTPAAANNFRKRLAQVLDLAVKMEWLASNPARQAKALVYEVKGHHTWTESDIAAFYDHHAPGGIAHRAMTLMLWTGAARVDAVYLGWFSIKDTPDGPRLQYRRQKTRRQKKAPPLVSIPIAPDLADLIADLPKDGTFLQTKFGKQRSAKSLTGDMRKWCDAAGLPDCTPHGLRKAIARRLAEAGASASQIGAVTGHKTLAEVQRYIDEANREAMATDGMELLLSRPNGEQKVANLPQMLAKKSSKTLK